MNKLITAIIASTVVMGSAFAQTPASASASASAKPASAAAAASEQKAGSHEGAKNPFHH